MSNRHEEEGRGREPERKPGEMTPAMWIGVIVGLIIGLAFLIPMLVRYGTGH